MSKDKVLNKGGEEVTFQISRSVGLINLSNGYVDTEGFYLCVGPGGTEGILYVTLAGGGSVIPVPVFIGWNPIIVTSVQVSASNTATNVYYGK